MTFVSNVWEEHLNLVLITAWTALVFHIYLASLFSLFLPIFFLPFIYNVMQDVFLIYSASRRDLEYAQDSKIQLLGFFFAISDAAFLTLVTGGFLYNNRSI